jgi:hypothetical protein
MAQGAVAIQGLKELQRVFAKMEDDVAGDLVMELQEAAEPVRKLTEQYILGGGGGFPGMRGIAASRDASYWSSMRVGVSKRDATAFISPSWRSNKGTLQGAQLALQYRFRMEGAVEDRGDEIEQQLEKMIDRIADHYGF